VTINKTKAAASKVRHWEGKTVVAKAPKRRQRVPLLNRINHPVRQLADGMVSGLNPDWVTKKVKVQQLLDFYKSLI